jgi:hypothetical protein
VPYTQRSRLQSQFFLDSGGRRRGILDFQRQKVAALSERDGPAQDRWSSPVTAQLFLKTIYAGKQPVSSR